MREQDKMKDKQLHLIYVEDQTKFQLGYRLAIII